MFILFNARCGACGRTLKVEADHGEGSSSGQGEYRFACPRCHAAGTVNGEHGVVNKTALGWAVPATVVLPITAP